MICYDIADDRRRVRVAAILSRYGERVQRSVFECHLSRAERGVLLTLLERAMDPHEDVVAFYPMCAADRRGIHIDGAGPPVLEDVGHWLL